MAARLPQPAVCGIPEGYPTDFPVLVHGMADATELHDDRKMAIAEAHATCLDGNFAPAAVAMLASALSDKGSYTEALVLHQKVLKFTQQRGPDHLLVASTQYSGSGGSG